MKSDARDPVRKGQRGGECIGSNASGRQVRFAHHPQRERPHASTRSPGRVQGLGTRSVCPGGASDCRPRRVCVGAHATSTGGLCAVRGRVHWRACRRQTFVSLSNYRSCGFAERHRARYLSRASIAMTHRATRACLQIHRAASMSPARSATAMIVPTGCAVTQVGSSEASTTATFFVPRRISVAGSTPPGPSVSTAVPPQ